MASFGKKQSIAILTSALALSLLAYWGTFSGEFQFDDDTTIIGNPYVADISSFFAIRLSDFIAGGLRPVGTFTFTVNNYFWGLDVRAYHVTNYLIHVLNGLAVFYLAYITMRSPRFPQSAQGRALFVATVASAIFLVHPLQTQAVSYLSQRYESLASLFYVSSLIAYIEARRSRPGGTRSRVYSLYALSVISGILALGTKQIAVTLPVVAILYDFYFLDERPNLKRIAGPAVFTVLALASAVLIVKGLTGSDAGFSVEEFTPWQYLLTQFKAITIYVKLAFIPVGQNLDYDLAISKSLFETGTVLSFLFLLSLFAGSIALFRRWRVASFFILWFFIILAPTSSFIPIVDPIFEHRAYLPSFGFYVIVADALWKGASWLTEKRVRHMMSASLAAASILIIILSALTFERNKVWLTKLSLWQDVVVKSPMKSRPHNNLGNCYMLMNRPLAAIEEYKKAINLDKNNYEAYYNMALNLEKVGLLDQAVYYYDHFSKYAPERYARYKALSRQRVEWFYRLRR